MRILVPFLVILPQFLWAQTTATVRSGAHDGYSRLVVTVDPSRDWQLLETRGEARLVFPDQTLDFQTDTVFDRISDQHLTAVESIQDDGGSILLISLPCACAATAFEFDDNYIVIDIHDGGPLPAEPVVAAYSAPPAYDYWQPEFLAIAPPVGQSDFFVPDRTHHQNQQIAENLFADDTEVMGQTNSLIDTGFERPDSAPDPAMLARIEEAQNQLLQQLTRAADQGLIDFVPAEPEVAVQEDPPEPPIEEPQNPLSDPELLRQLNARTAYDDAAESDLAEIVNAFAKPQCIENHAFSMVDWRGDSTFSAHAAALRADIYGEFDVINTETAIDLAKLYIAYGLSAEARMILATLPEQTLETAILGDMAAIVGGETWPMTGPVSKGENCGGSHEMWFLAGVTGHPEIVEVDPVVDAFATYPIDIRLIIGPKIAETYLDAGEIDAAHEILEIVRRAAVPDTASMQLTAANLLEQSDQQPAANVLFSKVASLQEQESPNAVVALARDALMSDHGVSEKLLTDLGAIAFAQRGTEIGAEARLWEIRVATQISGLNAGLLMIASDIQEQHPNAAKLPALTAEIMLDATSDQQGQLAYVESILAHRDLLETDGSADLARIHVANEMTKLGLPNIALEILAPVILEDHPMAEIAVAQAYLAQFESQKALNILVDNHSETAFNIRLAALFQQGKHAKIAEMLDNPANADWVRDDMAWRSGDWQNVQPEDGKSALAAFMQGEQQAMPVVLGDEISNETAFLMDLTIPETPNLQSAQTLLEVNRASRVFIEETLGETSN